MLIWLEFLIYFVSSDRKYIVEAAYYTQAGQHCGLGITLEAEMYIGRYPRSTVYL
jgi:hypothetical protein